MNDQRQAQLLDQFLAALREDASAAPPTGLDPALAAFARKLARQTAAPPSPDAQARMWHKALSAARGAQIAANGRAAHNPMEETTMMINPVLPRRSQPQAWTLVAALLLMTLGALALFARPPRGDEARPSGLADANALQDTTATPTPSLTFTPTPAPSVTWTLTPSATFIPTLVPTSSPIVAGGMPLEITPTIGQPDPAFALSPAAPASGALPPTVPPTVAPSYSTANMVEVELGTEITGALTAEHPLATFHFIAPQSGPITVHVESVQITQLVLGHAIARLGGGGGGGGGSTGQVPLISESLLTFSVQQGDDVVVTVASQMGEFGEFTLRMHQAESQPIAYGERTDGVLTRDMPVAYYTFTGQQGDVITARVVGWDGFDTRIEMRTNTPASLIVYDDDGGTGYDPEIYREQLPASGTYTLIVQSATLSGGSYTLELENEPPHSLDDGAQTVRFNDKLPPLLIFEGRAGESVELNVSAPEGDTTYVRSLYLSVQQNGVTIATMDREFGAESAAPQNGTLMAGGVQIPADGQVLVAVRALPALGESDTLRLDVALER